MRRRGSEPEPVRDVLSKILQGRGLREGAVFGRLAMLWEGTVGEGVARHASPARLSGGRLTVVVDSAAWMNQLSMLSVSIIEKVNKAAGADEVTELRFRLGSIEAKGGEAGARGRGKADTPPKRRRLTREELSEIESAVLGIEDEALRERARKAITAWRATAKTA